MTIRTRVSAEAIARAIKAQVAIQRGVADEVLTCPLSVVADAPDREGGNWHLDPIDHDAQIRATLTRAAAEVSRAYRLDS